LGKSEIGEQCAVDTFFEEHIGWFHIAMDQTLSMSCSHASGKILEWNGQAVWVGSLPGCPSDKKRN
jgi:hypothetical protein